ncbi:MAG: cell division protein FtsZ [Alphaproteobacteria bacterium]|nr:cell division protein FtsZ [Alphaproteobacteria bacterium]
MINIRMNTVDTTSKKLSPKITVVGVGGAGGNAVNNMIASNLIGVDFVVCNTDAQALQGNLADHKIQLGTSLTEGLGAGAKPEIGRAAAEESLDDVMQHLENANMAFITAGMGGGTGTGAAAVIAKACREKGILTVGVVTKPFHFEGSNRMRLAEEGINELQNYVDTLIVIPNQNLFRVVNDKTTFADAFKMADSVLQSAVRGVTDLIVMPGLINLDFADIRSVMQEMGKAVMGAGEASGERRATEAAEKAVSNPLLDDVSMKGAKGIIINVTGGYDMTLFEVDEACNRIRDEVDPNANIIFGSTFDESMEGTMRVSVVATGIDAAAVAAEKKTKAGTGGFVVERPKTRLEARQAEVDSAPSRPAAYPVAAEAPKYPAQQQAAARTYAPSYAQATAAGAHKYEEAVSSAHSFAAAPEFVNEPVAVASSAGEMAPRGARIGGSYIPPQPMEAGAGYHPQPVQVETSFRPATPAYQPQPAPAAVSPSSYYEAPAYQQPQPAAAPTAPVAKKKGPTLFERITGQYRRAEPVEEVYTPAPLAERATPQMPASDSAALRAPQRGGYQNPAQGRLNIDAPAAPPRQGEQEELDIPAFLRRQTS